MGWPVFFLRIDLGLGGAGGAGEVGGADSWFGSSIGRASPARKALADSLDTFLEMSISRLREADPWGLHPESGRDDEDEDDSSWWTAG